MRATALVWALSPMTCLTSLISKVSTAGTLLAKNRTNRRDGRAAEARTVEVVETQQGNGVVDVEAEGEGADKVLALLQGAVVEGVLGGAELDGLAARVHADLELEVVDEGRVDVDPVGLERGEAVRRDGDLACLDFFGGGL